MNQPDTGIFRRLSRRLRLAAAAAMAVIVLAALLTLTVAVLRWDAFGPRALGRIALTWSPVVFYLWALWTLRTMFSAFASGGLAFQPVVARALSRVGWALALGAATTVATAPIVLSLTSQPRMGGFAVFNLPAITLGVVGLALIAVAALLKRGMALEAEAASLKAELGEFF
jgi:DUF2975 family protein